MRRLELHASALSDAEYDFFTKSLVEIADDDVEPASGTTSDDVRFEEMRIGVREARAWFRGRYSRVPLPIIDGVGIFPVQLGFIQTGLLDPQTFCPKPWPSRCDKRHRILRSSQTCHARREWERSRQVSCFCAG
jgi:hypothetical protein